MLAQNTPTEEHRLRIERMNRLITKDKIVGILDEHLTTLEHNPGHAWHLKNKDGRTLIHLARNQKAVLNVRSAQGTINHLPNRHRPIGPGNRPSSKAGHKLALSLMPGLAHHLLTHYVNTPEEGPYDPQAHGDGRYHAICRFLRDSAAQHIGETITDRLNRTLLELTDPQVLELLETLDGNRTIHQYNAIAAHRDTYAVLSNTNPGPAAWALARRLTNKDTRHPGQVITQVKADLYKLGLNPSSWRSFSQAPPLTVKATRAGNPPLEDSACALNAMAQARSFPQDPPAVKTIVHTVRLYRNAKHNALDFGENPHTIHRAIKLMAIHLSREDSATPLPDPVLLTDYLIHLDNANKPLAATTLKGLVKRVSQWHQDIVRLKLLEDIARKSHIAQTRWNSLLQHHQEQNLKAVPLDSGLSLLSESARMNHCVHIHHHNCAQGHTRIFSIRSGDTPLATVRITLHSSRHNQAMAHTMGHWRMEEVRGPGNGPVNDDVERLAKSLAQLYDEAWQQPGNPGHAAWKDAAIHTDNILRKPGKGALQ